MEKRRGMNKKGAEMTIGTIIVIILALVVLVVIIYGFMTGWGNLWGKITGLGGGKANVDDNVRGCQLACSTSSKSDYCKPRNITFSDNSKPTPSSCNLLAQSGQYGLDACTTINCDENSNLGTCGSLKGAWQKNPCNTTQTLIDNSLMTNMGDRGDNSYCCKVTCTGIPGAGWSKPVCNAQSINIYNSLTDKEEGQTEDTLGATNCCIAKVTK
jgi:hypothetical protein